MKKIYMLLALTLVFSVSSCSTESSNTQKDKSETSQVETTEKSEPKEETKEEVKEEAKEELKISDVATIEVIGKQNIEKNISNGTYSDRVVLTIQATNNSDKQIKGIAGTLEIKDMFDKPILKMNCDLTGQIIEPNSITTFDDLGLNVNEFISDHVKLFSENYEDLKFSYKIKDIVYYDPNFVNETTNKSPKDSKVTVSVLSKQNIDSDAMKGIYSPRVEYTFKLTNLTDKDIKGIQGVLSIKDMFGNLISETSCDFTGNVIPANGDVTYENLGSDINQFLTDDVWLFNTSYDDLLFEYETSAIVYSDGTTE